MGLGSVKNIISVIKRTDRNQLSVRIVVVIVSVLLLLFAQSIMEPKKQYDGADQPVAKAKVVGIQSRDIRYYEIGDETIEEISITFFARILSGEYKGELVYCIQNSDPFYPIPQKEIEVGDKILVHKMGQDPYSAEWQLGEYLRTDALSILAAAYVVLLIIMGGVKGLWAILALGLTCVSVLGVFVSALLSGRNIYLWAILVCLFSIASTLLLVSGIHKKTLTASIGCAAGVGISGLLTLIMNQLLHLTGFVDENSLYLSAMLSEGNVDLNAIMFAGILIGALGAVMDVAMSISSALWEIAEQTQGGSFVSLFRSGITIGRDIMGTMANTLVLAYVGSSLSVVLLLIAYSTSMLGLLNREMIVVEVLYALVGSFGILCAIPLTSLACASCYPHKKAGERPSEEV